MKPKPVKLNTPYPTFEEMRKKLGMSKKRAEEVERLVEEVRLEGFAENVLAVLRQANKKYKVLILLASWKSQEKFFKNLPIIESLVERKAWSDLDVVLYPYRPKGSP